MSDEDNSQEIENILNDLAQSTSGEVEESNGNTDPTDKEELAKSLVEMTKNDREMADKIFQLFYPNLGIDPDKSKTSTKEAITRALELKINAGRNIIDLLKLLKEDQQGNSVGVFINANKAGIDKDNIAKGLEEDD